VIPVNLTIHFQGTGCILKDPRIVRRVEAQISIAAINTMYGYRIPSCQPSLYYACTLILNTIFSTFSDPQTPIHGL